MDLSAFAGVLTAIATIGTIVVALWQFKKTIANEEARRCENQFREKKQNAYLVDAWIVMDTEDSNHRHVVIQNNSHGAIRDVSFEVKWGSDKIETVPCFKGGWRLLPPGKWLVRKKMSFEDYSWGFPEPLPEQDIQFVPQFSPAQDYSICSLVFTDAFAGTWKRTYRDCVDSADSLTMTHENQDD